MLTLTEFLLARIAEDEAAARAAVEPSGAHWGADVNEWVAVVTTAAEFSDAYRGNRGLLWDWEDGYLGAAPESVAHIARHDPARVLAECEAKRRLVDLELLHFTGNVPRSSFTTPEVADAIIGRADTMGLRIMASIFADHPDYREEWKP